MINSKMDQLHRLSVKLWKLMNQRAFYLLLLLAVLIMLCSPMADASSGGNTAHAEKNWLDFAWRTFNFAVLAGLLYWLLAAKVKDFFVGRQDDIKKSLIEADLAKAEAKRKFAEYDAKLEKATAEIKEMEETIHLQGAAERERIVADALENAEKMKDNARKRIEQEMHKAQSDLRAEAVHLSVMMAEEILRKQVTVTDNSGLVREYIAAVAEKH